MKNKIALVSGANCGMGRAASEKYALLDYHVIMERPKDQMVDFLEMEKLSIGN